MMGTYLGRAFETTAALCVILFGTGIAKADVFGMPSGQTSVTFVAVGDVGNAPNSKGWGAVPYVYQMSTYDVTAGQYTAFLNAVARTDSFGLYQSGMNRQVNGTGYCHIAQSGSQGSYSYTVDPAFVNKPVDFVSLGAAMRFANWLTNGQPTFGVEDNRTTEKGSYVMDAATTNAQFAAITRSASAKYVVPSWDEWIKAAYYKGGSLNAGYWLYPTQSNNAPSNLLTAYGSNNANYYINGVGYSDPVNYLTDVGAFAESPGPYGTYDMGADVMNWTTAAPQPQLFSGWYFGPGGMPTSLDGISVSSGGITKSCGRL